MINLVTVVHNLTISECAQIWHMANKFQKHEIHLHIVLQCNPDQHHLTSLIYKLDWERANHNPDLRFDIYFPKQIDIDCESPQDLKWSVIEHYLKNQARLDYIVYIHLDVLFGQRFTNSMWDHISHKRNWFAGNSEIYGKNLRQSQEWHSLDDCLLISSVEQLEHHSRTNWPPIGIFDHAMKKRTEYTSWRDSIKIKYLTGANSFEWEKTIENMSESKVFETLAYSLLNTISERGDMGTGGITSAFD